MARFVLLIILHFLVSLGVKGNDESKTANLPGLVSDSVTTVKFRCPPCGCGHDETLFFAVGKCPSCNMPLVPANYGITKAIDSRLAPVFKDGVLGLIYPKLIYPIFMAGILFSAFLLSFGIKGRSLNVFLSGIILILSLYGFKNQLFGVQNDLTSTYKSLFTPISFILLIGPFIFFYTKSILSATFRWEAKHWLHFFPAILVFLSYTILLLMPEGVQRQFMSSPFEISFSHAEQIATVVLGFVYIGLALKTFNNWKASHAVRNTRLAAWLIRFLTGMGVLLLIWILIIFTNFWLYDFGVATLTYNLLWVLIGIVLLWMAAEIISNPKFFLINKQASLLNGNRMITDEELWQHKAKIENLMSNEKLYTDPDLSLHKLADVMDVNPRYLSMILNNAIGKSFYDLINYYRVEEVKQQLMNPDNKNLTIEAVANQAGFKSKSSFNSAFKKYTNMTPREFIRFESTG